MEEFGKGATWRAKAQKNRFIIEIHVICCLWLIVNVSGLSHSLSLSVSVSLSLSLSLGTCIFLVAPTQVTVVAGAGAVAEVDVRRDDCG